MRLDRLILGVVAALGVLVNAGAETTYPPLKIPDTSGWGKRVDVICKAGGNERGVPGVVHRGNSRLSARA